MRFFPLCINLENEDVILIGHGHHAEEKLEKLLPYGCRIRLFAEEGFEDFENHPQVSLFRRNFTEADLEQLPVCVIAADRSEEESRFISQLCHSRRIPVNVVDVPPLCSFYFPALITHGSFTLSITTSGKSPAAATLLRQKIEPLIPDRMEEIMDWSDGFRQDIRSRFSDSATRRRILKKGMALAMEQNRPLSAEEVEGLVNEEK